MARTSPAPIPLLFVMLMTVGCGRDDVPVSVGEVRFTERQLLGLSAERRELLAAMAGLGLAVARGELDRAGEPVVTARSRELLIRKLAAEVELRAAGIGDDVLEARYLTDPEYELTVRHLVLLSERWRPEAERAETRSRAEAALARVRGGEDLGDLAAELSEEPGAAGTRGLLRPGREGSWVPEFWQAASALEPGEVSEVVESQYGFHVLRLEDRTPVPFADARDRVVMAVAGMVGAEDAWQAFVDTATASVRLAPDAMDAWLEGQPPDSTALAVWEGGRLTVGEFDRHVAAQVRGAALRMRSDGELLRTAVAGAAREMALAARAAELGIAVTESEREGFAREWRDEAGRWAAALGFREGLSSEAVAELALSGLGSTQQGVAIVREEVVTRSPLFRAAYPTRVDGAGG